MTFSKQCVGTSKTQGYRVVSAAVVGGGETLDVTDISQSCINDTPLYTLISPTYLVGAVGGRDN